MKHILNKTSLALAAAGWLTAGLAHADIQLPIPAGDFTDGSLVYNSATPTNICIDLSRAVTGVWTERTTGTNITRGIYDPEKWAVVFKYTSVTIGANVTICFTNHPSHAPVVWIVEGNVRIDGRVTLDGEPGNIYARHTEPGPGGGYGGIGETSEATPAGDGLGWGGGSQSTFGGAGSFAGLGSMIVTAPRLDRPAGLVGTNYGAATCLPLRGGSGGSGSGEPGLPQSTFYAAYYVSYATDRSARSGGAGGGAIAILSGRSILINGSLTANGGAPAYRPYDASQSYGVGGAGSGGAIRLVADSISGIGRLEARGLVEAPTPSVYDGIGTAVGGNGRIRIETVRNQMGGLATVPGPSVVPLSGVPQLWPAPAAPSVRILRVAQTAITPTPLGNIDSGFTDAQVNAGPNETEVIVEGANLAPDATVEVRVVPKFGPSTVVNCVPCPLGCGPANAGTNYWRAVARFGPDLSVLQARAVGQ